jgi:MoxR-like ATPase
MAGVHRLTRALQDRIDLWIYLGYPEKEVEMEIISLNCPASELTNFDLELIYSMINNFRMDERVAEPPSIRASVSLASLYAKARKSNPDADPRDLVYHYSTAVLKGHTKFKALVEDQDKVREEIIRKSLDEIMEK